MERQQIIKLIDNKGTSSKEETTDLWDIVRMFPYFQTARLLLVKSFHRQGSIHFHNELKTAAAYASDRKVLYHFIHDKTEKQDTDEKNNVFVIEPKQPAKKEPVLKLKEPDSENQLIYSSETEKHIEPPSFEDIYSKIVMPELPSEEKETTEATDSSFDEPSTAQEEIIRRRLNEILSPKESVSNESESLRTRNKPEVKKSETPAVENSGSAKNEFITAAEATEAKEENEPVKPSILDNLPSKPIDEIEGLEIGSIIEENYLQELEKLPVISEPVENAEENIVQPESKQTDLDELSFIDWLKQKASGKTTVEEVKDEPFYDEKESVSAKPVIQSIELINKFIETTPRITPVKAEFYSPANMARQSIVDNEEIISETLADIYFKQGNYEKARSYYERLSLLYPEKSGFFAPLLKKIEDIIKNQA